jgi:hypothetical protein
MNGDDLDKERLSDWEEADDWDEGKLSLEQEIAEENRLLRKRQDDFRRAAEYVASAFSQIPAVSKVVLFGSVALPLKKEVPRFRKFRRAGIKIWHECKDVDLAVWIDDLNCVNLLGKARGRAVNQLFDDTGIGVAHHQVDVFIMQPETDRYLGRLCCFGQCPKGKPECRVPGCGATPFLQQHKKFVLHARALAPQRVILLYEREAIEAHITDVGEGHQ